jgi:chitobiase/beta-hexosaminidase-like protein
MRHLAFLSVLLLSAVAALGQTAATPTFSPPAGTYTSSQTVTISTTSTGSFSTGANAPTAVGSCGSPWTNCSRIELNDGSYATASIAANATSGPIGGSNYGFSIPSTATIAGISMSIVHSDVNNIGSLHDSDVQLTKAGTPVGSNLAHTGLDPWNSGPETYSYGGSTNLWGTTWTYADINATGFGSYLRVINGPGSDGTGIAGVDFISITVYYTQSAVICYTTSGATPATNGSTGCTTGALYTSPITVASTETVKAVAGGTGFTDSSVASALYTILVPAVTPTCTPGAGTYTSAQSVTCSTTSPSSVICYTTNGATPATNGGAGCTAGTLYSGAISVSVSETLKVVAGGSLYTDSPVGSYAYVILIPSGAPTFSPVAGTYSTAQNVTISSAAFTVICYTTNGTTPATNGAAGCTTGSVYSAPVNIPTTRTLKAIAGGTGYMDSSVTSGLYTISTVATMPTCTPGTGSYVTSVTVTCMEVSSGAHICYTTNGTTPATNGASGCTAGTLYSTSLTFTSTTTLKVIGGGTGYTDSSVATYTYSLAPIPVPCVNCRIF